MKEEVKLSGPLKLMADLCRETEDPAMLHGLLEELLNAVVICGTHYVLKSQAEYIARDLSGFPHRAELFLENVRRSAEEGIRDSVSANCEKFELPDPFKRENPNKELADALIAEINRGEI